MKGKKNFLYSLIIILAGVINNPVLAQQTNDVHDIVYQLDIKKSKIFL